VNAYGRSKAAGELALEQCGASYLLIRTSWVYAPWGKNFVLTMLGLASSRPNLRVVSDQVGCPSSAEGIAKTTLALLDAEARGTFHVTDAGHCSWFELARFAIGEAGLECDVQPCTSEEFVRPAKRPSYSVLDSALTVERVGALLPWREAVRGVVSRVEPRANK
jgi:dTDP-4-dehydrorhamnose reductase